ncbi:glycosyltransferase [Chryseobacterium daecheongense]|uniref:glycosyltransferase n=1 Tax=Chryseobacterium daecheongense TaxID=192389 RepID=UPI001FD6F7F9|nr:glycosyltransferase [Chryseobacterium daecheongense]UOU99038.1 glycosyltransferase [Chryseobacterium daecheongense]
MKVSVALCTYNGEKYLSGQLDSIIDQTIQPNEIIICDDRSTDKTIEILSEYQAKYPEIFKVFVNEDNLGFVKNFEKAVYLCSHEIIIISDQDDIWEKDKISETIHFFENNSKFDGVFHDLKLMDEETIQPSYLNWKNISHETIKQEIKEGELFTALVVKGSFILGCCLAIRREALKKHELKDFQVAHDYFIVQKLSMRDTLGFIPKSLSSYRLHSNQVYGLRYKSEAKNGQEEVSESRQYFKDHVYRYLIALKRAKELFPNENIKDSDLYSKFISRRNIYLNKMGFVEKKLYVAKCIRHQYLDLRFTDLFRI